MKISNAAKISVLAVVFAMSSAAMARPMGSGSGSGSGSKTTTIENSDGTTTTVTTTSDGWTRTDNGTVSDHQQESHEKAVKRAKEQSDR